MAEQFEIRRAERKRARLRFAVCAASNGGKTWTSIELAFGIVEELLARNELSGTLEGKVGLVDTERRSGELYAHLGPYDVIELGPPYTVERYVGAMQALERAGVAVIILDSISHAWAGPGGVLALLDRFEDKQRFSAFGSTVNPAQDEFVDAMLRSPCHVIATMRSKTAWVLEDKQTRSGSTVKAPRRIGMAPIQRPGIEYEFTTLVDLDTTTHKATVVKNRCPVFADWMPKLLTREHGRALAAWMLEGAPEAAPAVDGTPEERCEAGVAAALRAIERCTTVPDLARVFDEAQKAARGFAAVLSPEKIRPWIDQLVSAKDARKIALGGDRAGRQVDTSPGESPSPPPAGPGLMQPVLTDAEDAELRELIREAGIRIAEVLERYSVARIGLIARERFAEVRDWLSTQIATQKARAGKGAPGKDHFADMTDDVPF